MAHWKMIRCPSCNGHQMVHGMNGEPTECNDCEYSGSVWISDKDRLAEYPGGPFKGMWPGRYARQDTEPVA